MALIKEKLRRLIADGDHRLAFSIWGTAAPTIEFLQAKGRLSRLEKDDLLGEEDSKGIRLELNRILNGLDDSLPNDDFKVFKSYLSELSKEGAAIRASNLLRKCSRRFQYLPVEDATEEEEGQIISNLESEIEWVSMSDMLPDWEGTLWSDLFNYVSVSTSTASSEILEEGDYLGSIIELSKKPRWKVDLFLVWSEQYAAGDFDDAFETAKILRNHYPKDTPSYEYLFLSYARVCQKEEIPTWFLRNSNEYRKLVVYVGYANRLFKNSETLRHSLERTGRVILNELEKYYKGINYDYVVKSTERTSVQKKEQVLEVLLSCWKVMEDFNIKTGHPIFEKLLVELLGGAKFRWMQSQQSGVENLPNYDAKEAVENFKKMLVEVDPPAIDRALNLLKNNLRYKISTLPIVRNQVSKQRELRNACWVVDSFFPDKGFSDLAKSVKKGSAEGLQEEIQPNEAIRFSEKEALDFTDNKTREMFPDDWKEKTGISQPPESQAQVSPDENLDEVKSQGTESDAGSQGDISEPKISEHPQGESAPKFIPENVAIFGNEVSQPHKLFQAQIGLYIKVLIFILGCVALYFLRADGIGALLCLLFLTFMGVGLVKKV